MPHEPRNQAIGRQWPQEVKLGHGIVNIFVKSWPHPTTKGLWNFTNITVSSNMLWSLWTLYEQFNMITFNLIFYPHWGAQHKSSRFSYTFWWFMKFAKCMPHLTDCHILSIVSIHMHILGLYKSRPSWSISL